MISLALVEGGWKRNVEEEEKDEGDGDGDEEQKEEDTKEKAPVAPKKNNLMKKMKNLSININDKDEDDDEREEKTKDSNDNDDKKEENGEPDEEAKEISSGTKSKKGLKFGGAKKIKNAQGKAKEEVKEGEESQISDKFLNLKNEQPSYLNEGKKEKKKEN